MVFNIQLDKCTVPMYDKHMKQAGFTLIEILIVIVIIGVMAAVVLIAINPRRIQDETRFSQAKEHLSLLNNAMESYVIVHGGRYPDDVDRGIPSGLEKELKTGDWPHTPWGPPTTYDWDNITENGEHWKQFSIRFCELGNPSNCRFPELEWAEDFDSNSSVYWCMEGPCRAHRNSSRTHPALCVNCKEGEFDLD